MKDTQQTAQSMFARMNGHEIRRVLAIARDAFCEGIEVGDGHDYYGVPGRKVEAWRASVTCRDLTAAAVAAGYFRARIDEMLDDLDRLDGEPPRTFRSDGGAA